MAIGHLFLHFDLPLLIAVLQVHDIQAPLEVEKQGCKLKEHAAHNNPLKH